MKRPSVRETIGGLVDALRAKVQRRTATETTATDPYVISLLGSLGPDGDRTFMRLAYIVLLGRPVDRATLEREAEALAHGERTRADVIREIVSSLEFRETAIVEEALTRDAAVSDRPQWPATSERVVELPWVIKRLPARGRVLDIGYAWASWVYLKNLIGSDAVVYGADLAVRSVPFIHRTKSDARWLPFRDGVFDVVTCVSTVEHVGRDNDRYGIRAPADPHGDAAALGEIRRVLAPGGRALVTIPMGAAHDHGWFVQYDRDSWAAVVEQAALVGVEQQAFRLTDDGWVGAEIEELDGLLYGDGAPGARGVLCTALGRRDR